MNYYIKGKIHGENFKRMLRAFLACLATKIKEWYTCYNILRAKKHFLVKISKLN